MGVNSEVPNKIVHLIGSFVVAGFAAGFAVHQAVVTNANVDDRLAQATELFAIAVAFRLLALRAAVFRGAGSGTHEANVARNGKGRKMTLVIKNRPQTSGL
jgi:hypothetical protein